MDQSRQPPASYPAPLSDAEIELILDDLDGFETPEEVVAQRQHVRQPYHARLSVVCETHDDSRVRFTATALDLSDGGMGLVAPQATPRGTVCVVALLGPHGREESVTGRVVSCEPYEGRVHLWGVRFDEPIRAEVFLQSKQAG